MGKISKKNQTIFDYREKMKSNQMVLTIQGMLNVKEWKGDQYHVPHSPILKTYTWRQKSNPKLVKDDFNITRRRFFGQP